MKKLRWLALLVGGLMADGNAQAQTVNVFTPRDDNLQWMNFYVAQGAGLFEEEGLTVEVLTGRDGGSRSESDFAVLPRPTHLSLIARGQPVVAFANLMANDPVSLVARRDVATARSLAADSPLRERLEALQGLKVAAASGPRPRLRYLLESAGLNADRHIETVMIPGRQQHEAFGSGRVDATYSHTPFLETAIAEQDGVAVVNQDAGDVPRGASEQIHMLATTREYIEAKPQAVAAILMGPPAATAGPILKTAERLAAEMAPAVLSQPQQESAQPRPTFTENVTVVSSAPMITKRSWLRIAVGSALTSASVFVPNDADPAEKWTARFALSVVGGALTHWLGEIPDNDRMGREYVVAIAACMQLSNLDIASLDLDLLAMACPGVSRPQTQEAQDIGTGTIDRAYRSAIQSPQEKAGLQPRAAARDAADDLRARFVGELRAAADDLIR